MRFTNQKILIRYQSPQGEDRMNVLTFIESIDKRKLRKLLVKYLRGVYNYKADKRYVNDLIKISTTVYSAAAEISEEEKTKAVREWLNRIQEPEPEELQDVYHAAQETN